MGPLPLTYKPPTKQPAEAEPAKEPPADGVDLFARTWESLDFGVVLEHLSKECWTAMGRKAALKADFKADVESVQALYRGVEEVYSLTEPVPIASGMDIEAIIALAAKGTTLEPPELREVSDCLTSLSNLKRFFNPEEGDAPVRGVTVSGGAGARYPTPTLQGLTRPIYLDPELVELLHEAFDATGELCGKKFPELGRLRARIDKLYDSIRQSVQKLLSSGTFSGMLADEGRGAYVSEVNGRFVLPVKPTYKRNGTCAAFCEAYDKRNVGIVHDVSRTGKTLFIEPSSVVEPTNELVELKLALKAEEARILSRMTIKVGQNQRPLLASLSAAAEVDLACARARLGARLGGTIPEVGSEGAIRLRAVRHPVLALRGKDPVPNDLELDAASQALVLTGPNAGGKTVVLKTLGLVALMARAGIPVPAARGARVDVFDPVLADIGDLQSVTGDLSTFSGHLMVCKAVLERARPGALVLMDEMGSGTDPAQGVALAQALLEALLDSGARVALTTHYLQLKELAAGDARFKVAAMQFVEGRPTYRLMAGAIGESFALAVAERLQLPAPVLERAKSLLDEGTRQVSDLIRELEQERENLRLREVEMNDVRAQLKAREDALEEAKREVERKKADARREAAEEYAIELEAREAKLKEVFEKLKEDPSLSIIGSSIGSLRAIKAVAEEEARGETIKAAAEEEAQAEVYIREKVDDLGLTPLTPDHELSLNEKVVVCARGIMYGREGTVVRVHKKSGVDVNVGGRATIKYQLHELSLPPTAGFRRRCTSNSTEVDGNVGGRATIKYRPHELSLPLIAGFRRRSGIKAQAGGRGSGGTSRRVAQYMEQEIASSGGRKGSRGYVSITPSVPVGPQAKAYVRTPANTLDLRGKSLEESKLLCDQFFNRCIMNGNGVAFVLHGHGTEVLKKGLRAWLPKAPMVKRARPADSSDGGDAYTVVELS
ncbi:muts protein-like protein 1B muts-like ATPase [Tribonema minus]|uniref:Muts protein-like protein 1B muts-like ATPase n=1 Tax=Tribonema minus TaxID=303371 RepID=A0A835YZI9_9STRA|nr:muts protein-like protein 1B muts-like ATPase [Tribonema minus]